MSRERTVAFLRGINLGKRRIEMARLREVFEGMGLGDVRTFIASGNVIFDRVAQLSEDEVAGHLEASLGFRVETHLRTMEEVRAASVANLPAMAGEPGVNVHVMFLRDPLREAAERALHALETEDDRFYVRGREAYWLRRGGLSDSPLTTKAIAGALGTDHTVRTLNTVRRLVEKFS